MNYAKVPFNFIIESTNDYLIQPTNDYLVQPTGEFVNYRVIKPCKSILKINDNDNDNDDDNDDNNNYNYNYNDDNLNKNVNQNVKQKKSAISQEEPTKFVRFSDLIQNNISSSHNSINSHNSVEELSNDEFESIRCFHLKKNNQTYFEHLSESLSYSGQSFKASLYFLVHAFIPDIFQYNGSATIYSLTDSIKTKYESNLVEK